MNRMMMKLLAVPAAGAIGWAVSGGSPLVAAVSAAMTALVMVTGPKKKDTHFGTVARGTQVATGKKRRGFASDQIEIGGIAIPREAEPQHFLLTGGPGTGKSVVCQSTMDVARARGQRAVVYDSTGEFVAHYYRPDHDMILSPIDARSALWSPWTEGRNAFAYENLAQALIPDGTGENQFWAQAARAILRAALAATVDDLPSLIDLIFAQDQEVLMDCLQAQGLAGLAGPQQMLASSRGEAATYIAPLAYLPAPGPTPFSVRDWVRDESSDSWLFISSRADVHKSIRPLISMWIGLAVQAIMSLPVNRDRRVWVILDELPTLQKLSTLDVALAGGRKYGIAAVLGVQSIAQIRDPYGRDAASAILSHPATRLTLRVGDSETAEYLSKSLGDRHTIRKVQSESKTGGGSKSESEQHSIEAAVLPSEILALPDLTGYLRIPNDPIIKKIRLTPRDRETLAEPYVDRPLAVPPPAPTAPPSAPSVLDKHFLASITPSGPDLPDL